MHLINVFLVVRVFTDMHKCSVARAGKDLIYICQQQYNSQTVTEVNQTIIAI